MSKGYKWIVAERESLDPYVDYERIWELTSCYYINDFMMNFLYTNGFPYFIMTPQAIRAIYRGGEGKTYTQPDKREKDTADHFWRWFEYGPSHPITQKSVQQVNATHAAIAKKVPGAYSELVDYTYTMCWIAADMHRLRMKVGLSGYSEKQKIATHLYWQELAKLFRGENDMLISDFPTSFDGMLKYMSDHESKGWPFNKDGALASKALVDQFANKWFPKGFRYFGRALILSLMDEPPRRVHNLPYPNIVVRKIMAFGFAALFYGKEHILPDPKISTPAKKRLAKAGPKSRPAMVA